MARSGVDRDYTMWWKVTSCDAQPHEAIQSLRRTTIGKLLWIDAICINQADLQERSRGAGISLALKEIADQGHKII